MSLVFRWKLLLTIKISKHEYRMSKQYRILKYQILKTEFCFENSNFENLKIVSDFEI